MTAHSMASLPEPMFVTLPDYGDEVSEAPTDSLAELLSTSGSQVALGCGPSGFIQSRHSTRAQSDLNGMEGATLAMEAKKQQMQQQSQQTRDGRRDRNSGAWQEDDMSRLKAAGGRWWMRSVVLCPLCNFPISFIPYPPFKLRVEPDKPKPHVLVDGKFLAMQVIVDLGYVACNRTLVKSDMDALDEYIRRCKLGPFRPGQAFGLAQEAALAVSPEKRIKAQKDLDRLIAQARNQLGKLRRIQEGRMRQVSDSQEIALSITLEEAKSQAGIGSESSTTFGSTTASTASFGSYLCEPEVCRCDPDIGAQTPTPFCVFI
mmetsp:Transcript_32563/g.74402  ORF Transcript_32563/g.74402 Transcript_32563/m.74402 type:complete len:317 (+) Transcript_32563:90-1040(+)